MDYEFIYEKIKYLTIAKHNSDKKNRSKNYYAPVIL